MAGPQLFLLGDSVIDNGAYVGAGEPNVPAQVAAMLPGWDVTSRALDGSLTPNVLAQARDLPTSAAVFLSTGGNDALDHIGLLSGADPLLFSEAMAKARELREAFRSVYAPLLDSLADRQVLVATTYNPRFTGAEAALQPAAEGALSFFNDVIQQEALARDMAVLNMARLFNEEADYANPIEPSAQGGLKLAGAIAQWANEAQAEPA